jgi:hypothetical protein
VANNLNDIGKVHPALLTRTAARWLEKASPERRALVEHALRTAVKRGHPEALRLLGYGRTPSVVIDEVAVTPRRVVIGGRVAIRFVVKSASRASQRLLIDLAVHFVKSSGRTAPKVFKLRRLVLPPDGRAELQTSVSLKVHTTRTPRPGVHAVDAIVNGIAHRIGAFQVRAQ